MGRPWLTGTIAMLTYYILMALFCALAIFLSAIEYAAERREKAIRDRLRHMTGRR